MRFEGGKLTSIVSTPTSGKLPSRPDASPSRDESHVQESSSRQANYPYSSIAFAGHDIYALSLLRHIPQYS